MLINLVKDYLASKNKAFKKYIKGLIEKDKDNSSYNLISNILIVRVANKYKIYIWNSILKIVDKVDKELIALYTKVNHDKS